MIIIIQRHYGVVFQPFGCLNVAAKVSTPSLLFQKSSLSKRKLNIGSTMV